MNTTAAGGAFEQQKQQLEQELELARAKVRLLEKGIEAIEGQIQRRDNPFMVVLTTESDQETKYTHSQEHANQLIEKWLENVRLHSSYGIEPLAGRNGFTYWYMYPARFQLDGHKTTSGIIEIVANPEYVAVQP